MSTVPEGDHAGLPPASYPQRCSCHLWASGMSLAFSPCSREQSGLDHWASPWDAQDRPTEELPKTVPKRDMGNGGHCREKVEAGLGGRGFEERRSCSEPEGVAQLPADPKEKACRPAPFCWSLKREANGGGRPVPQGPRGAALPGTRVVFRGP